MIIAHKDPLRLRAGELLRRTIAVKGVFRSQDKAALRDCGSGSTCQICCPVLLLSASR